MRPFRRLTSSWLRLGLTIAAAACGLLLAATPVRHAMLRGIGGVLIVSDAVVAADLIAIDSESGYSGVLAASDLYKQGKAPAVAVLVGKLTAIDRELERRGVQVPRSVDVLAQLGIPRSAIAEIAAGEGGTTESTAALGAWIREHPGTRLLVIVSATHSRRYARALRRVWPDTQPRPAVVVTPYGLFRKEDWWRSRRTIRDGLIELQKLGLDYVTHPIG